MTTIAYCQNVLLSDVGQTVWLSTDVPGIDRNDPYMSKTQTGNFKLFPGTAAQNGTVYWGDLLKIASPDSKWLSSRNTVNDTAEWQSTAASPWPVLDKVMEGMVEKIKTCIEGGGSFTSCVAHEILDAIISLLTSSFVTDLRMSMFQCAVLCPATGWTQGGLYDAGIAANLLLLDVRHGYIVDPKIKERDLAIIGYLLLYALIVKFRSLVGDLSPLGALQTVSLGLYQAIADQPPYLLSQDEGGVGPLKWHAAAQIAGQQFALAAECDECGR